jgi:hypothetical protein
MPSKPSDSVKPWNNGTADDFKQNWSVAYFSIVRPVFPTKTGGFDVRWVRFPKHISLFFTLSQLESVIS